MKVLLLIGAGGAAGSMLRYTVSGWVQRLAPSSFFPYGTLVVNLIGCLLIGLLSQLAESRGAFSPEVRSLIFVGFLGGFTTFSTFGNESFNLLRGGQTLGGLANLALHLLLGLAAVWLGRSLADWIWR